MSKVRTTSILLISLFLILSARTFGQNSSQTDSIVLIAKQYADSVVLRWAPSNYLLMERMRKEGVYIERRRIGEKTFRRQNVTPIKALRLEEFEEKANTDDKYVYAAAHALYEKVNSEKDYVAPMSMALEKYQEQNQRYAMAALSADLSSEAASALGWRYCDTKVEKGALYEYRIVLEELDRPNPLKSNPKRLSLVSQKPLGKVEEFRIDSGDKELMLIWPKYINDSRFIAYHVEYSRDGGNTWIRHNELPKLTSSADLEALENTYVVPLEKNYVSSRYRVIGYDSFADESLPSKVIEAYGLDLTAPMPPTEVRARDLLDGRMEIQWTNLSEALDHAGFIVTRSRTFDGNYQPITTQPISKSSTSFIDENPYPYIPNYYAIYSLDTAGNVLRSNITTGLWIDNEVPSTPEGLVGRVDSTGRVVLIWSPGEEPDLLGYRVYKSYAKNREFIQITKDIIHQNYFFDETSLKALDQKVYYKIVAIDNAFNPSEYSTILSLRKPDKIPPSSPTFHNFEASAESITLEWNPSSSNDVVRQEIWRKQGDESWELYTQLDTLQNSFTDKKVRANQKYAYRVSAIDEAGWMTSSKSISLYTGNHIRFHPITEFSISQEEFSGGIVIKWSEPIDQGRMIIYKSQGNAPLRAYKYVSGDATVFTDNPASAGEVFNYALQYIGDSGQRGKRSEIQSITLK